MSVYITYIFLYLCRIIPSNTYGDERLEMCKINQIQYTIRRVPTTGFQSTETICVLFNNTATSSHYIASDDRMIYEHELGRIWKRAIMA
jgi:hypothetical protein